jgi:hypothetical protein
MQQLNHKEGTPFNESFEGLEPTKTRGGFFKTCIARFSLRRRESLVQILTKQERLRQKKH